MTTNILGHYFISYRRSPGRSAGNSEATVLREAMINRGLPVWRDVNDLAHEPLEEDVINVLSDSNTAGAVLLVSPEVADSAIIRNIEAYRIFKRHNDGDGFIVVPVMIQLNHDEANTVLGAPAGFQNVNDWNLQAIDTATLEPEQARVIACEILKRRLSALANVERDSVLSVGMYSRRSAPTGRQALTWDFSHYFEDRVSQDGAYDIFEKALVDSATAITNVHEHPQVNVDGYAPLTLGVLFGAIFTPLAGFRLSWTQEFAGQPSDPWSLATDVKKVTVVEKLKHGDSTSEDVVLALGISANIETAVANFLAANDIGYRAALHVSIEDDSLPQGHQLSPGEGLSVVYQAIDAVRRLKDDYGLARINLHLFMACPVAMAVLLGQKLNTISSCTLYDHLPEGSPAYKKVHSFNPSGFSYN